MRYSGENVSKVQTFPNKDDIVVTKPDKGDSVAIMGKSECEALKLTFSNLLYPSQLIGTTVNKFITNVAKDNLQSDADRNNDTTPTVMFSISFISQSAADSTRRQLQDLSSKISVSLQPIFTSKKIGEIIKTREPKSKIINEQCVVYQFKCGLCEIIGFTNRHLFQLIN